MDVPAEHEAARPPQRPGHAPHAAPLRGGGHAGQRPDVGEGHPLDHLPQPGVTALPAIMPSVLTCMLAATLSSLASSTPLLLKKSMMGPELLSPKYLRSLGPDQ